MAMRAPMADPLVDQSLKEPLSLAGNALPRGQHRADHTDISAESGGLDTHRRCRRAERSPRDRQTHRVQNAPRLLLGYVATARERLYASERSASAARDAVRRGARRIELERYRPMTDLARGVRRAAQHAAAAHDRAAEPRRYGHIHVVAHAVRGARHALGDRRHARVAVEEDRSAVERIGEPRREREVDESRKVRCVVDDARAVVERSGRRAADGDDLVQWQARVPSRRASTFGDRVHRRIGTFAWRRALVARDDVRMGAIRCGDHAADVRGTEVDADEVVVAQTLGSLPASSGVASATLSLPRALTIAALYPFFALSLPKAFSASE